MLRAACCAACAQGKRHTRKEAEALLDEHEDKLFSRRNAEITRLERELALLLEHMYVATPALACLLASSCPSVGRERAPRPALPELVVWERVCFCLFVLFFASFTYPPHPPHPPLPSRPHPPGNSERQSRQSRRGGAGADQQDQRNEAKENTAADEERAAALRADMARWKLLLDEKEWGARYPDERFSFIKTTERMDPKDLEYWRRRVVKKERAYTGEHWLIRALYRGIAIHHEGMWKAYRDLVEVMFRGRHLKVLISTGTLSVGVNLPCRSAVFAFDSRFLNPLQYRQMSGRAGRRGYDDKGQVIFFGVPPSKACRLVSAPLPSLSGAFVLTVGTLLRLLFKFKHVESGAGKHRALASLSKEQLAKPLHLRPVANAVMTDIEFHLVKSFYAFTQRRQQHSLEAVKQQLAANNSAAVALSSSTSSTAVAAGAGAGAAAAGSQPQPQPAGAFYAGLEESNTEMVQQFRFALEYLVKAGLVEEKTGDPVPGLGSLVLTIHDR